MLAKECVLDVCISLVCQFSVLLLCLIYTHPSPPHTLMELVINMAGGGGLATVYGVVTQTVATVLPPRLKESCEKPYLRHHPDDLLIDPQCCLSNHCIHLSLLLLLLSAQYLNMNSCQRF